MFAVSLVCATLALKSGCTNDQIIYRFFSCNKKATQSPLTFDQFKVFAIALLTMCRLDTVLALISSLPIKERSCIVDRTAFLKVYLNSTPKAWAL